MATETKHMLEIRVTPWREFGSYGFSHYRIWQQFDGLRWFQRHEWARDDGSPAQIDAWINGAEGWCPDAARILEAV